MANKPVIYKFEDSKTGKTYQLEGDADTTEAEAMEYLGTLSDEELGQYVANVPSPTNQNSGPVAAQSPAGPSGVQSPKRQDIQTVAVNDSVSNDDPRFLAPEEESELGQLWADPETTDEQYAARAKELSEKYGRSYTGPTAFGEERTAYQKYLAEGGEPLGVNYSDWSPEDVVGPYNQQYDPDVGDWGATLEGGMAENLMGAPTRWLNDWFDMEQQGGFTKDTLRERYPDLNEDQIEEMHDGLIGEFRRRERVNAEYQQDERGIGFAARLPGNIIGGSSPVDIVPIGRGVSLPARALEAAGENALADIGLQTSDMAYGGQDEYNPGQTFIAGAGGAALHGALTGTTALATSVGRRLSREAPVPVADRAPISVPTARRNSKKYGEELVQTADGIIEHGRSITDKWENAPEFEVHRNFNDLDGIDNDAIGVSTPDGKVLLNTEAIIADAKARKIDVEDVVSAVTYHESLGHFGLAQRFGDELESILSKFYDNGSSTFRKKVDDWLEANPDSYVNSPNRELRAAEEILAEWSEQGRIPVTFVNRITDMVKKFARDMGLDLKFSEREIRSILSMAHGAVVNGKGRDVAGNGFRFSMPGEFVPRRKPDGRMQAEDKKLRRKTDRDNIRQQIADAKARGIDPEELGLPRDPDVRYMKGSPEKPVPLLDQLYQRRDKSLEDHDKFSAAFRAYAKREWDKYVKEAGGPENVLPLDRFIQERLRMYHAGMQGNAGARQMMGDVRGPYEQELTPQDVRYMKKKAPDVTDDQRIAGARQILSGALEGYEPTYHSWDDAKTAVRDRGLTAKQIRAGKGIRDLDKRLFQYDRVAEMTDQKLVALHEKMERGEFTANDKADYLHTVFKYNELLARIFDDQAEIGRALNAMKAISFTKNKLTNLNKVLSEYEGNNISAFADEGTFQQFTDQMRYLMATGNSVGAHSMMKTVLKPYWWQYILSFRHAMMLSGLGTHAKNTLDNSMMIARELEEQMMALPGGVARKGLRAAGVNVAEGVSPQEVGARIYGLIRAALDAGTYTNTLKAFRDGHGNTPYSSKIEMQDAHIPVVSKVQDTLHAADTFFRAFHNNANMYTLGVREARAQGFKGKAAFEEGTNLAANPTDAMIADAKNLTDIALLVDKPSTPSSKLEAAKAIRPGMKVGEQAWAFIANTLFPFFRVTDRLLFQQLRRSPLAFLDHVTRQDLAAGGARMDIALARMAYGSALIYSYWQAAGEGEVTGAAPADHDKKAALEAGGYLPNSVKEDGKMLDASALNLSFLPGDKQNAVATNVATIRQAYEKGQQDEASTAESLGYAMLSLMTVLSSASFAENVGTYIEPFMSQDEGNRDVAVANVAGNLASQYVPAAVRQYNQMYGDPVKRDTVGDKSIPDRIAGRVQSAIPPNPFGIPSSDELPAKYDVYGDQMTHGRTLSGVDNYQEIKTDDVSVELQRLEATTDSTVVRGAPASFEYEGERIRLNAAERQEWQRVQGYYLRYWMGEEIRSPEWKQMTDEEKIAVVKSVRTDAYEQTKDHMLPMLVEAPEDD